MAKMAPMMMEVTEAATAEMALVVLEMDPQMTQVVLRY